MHIYLFTSFIHSNVLSPAALHTLVSLQNQQQRLEVELASLKTYGLILAQELEKLNMVGMLSHFGLRVLDTGEPPGHCSPSFRAHARSLHVLAGPSSPGPRRSLSFTHSRLRFLISSLSACSRVASVSRLCAGAGGYEAEL